MKHKKRYNRYINHKDGELTEEYKNYRHEMDVKIVDRKDWSTSGTLELKGKYIPAGLYKNV